MTRITNGEIVFDPDELAWFADNYGGTDWIVYVAGMDEIVTHDKQGPGEDPAGDPFTEETVYEHLHELDRRFGPGSPMDLGDPLYAVAMHHGVPAFGSHRHSHPCQPPHGTFWKPGDCACGRPYSAVEAQIEQEMAAVEWSVYVAGPNSWLSAQPVNVDGVTSFGPAFTEGTAKAYAAGINAAAARWNEESSSPFNPVIRAVVLHRGQPVNEAAAIWKPKCSNCGNRTDSGRGDPGDRAAWLCPPCYDLAARDYAIAQERAAYADEPATF